MGRKVAFSIDGVEYGSGTCRRGGLYLDEAVLEARQGCASVLGAANAHLPNELVRAAASKRARRSVPIELRPSTIAAETSSGTVAE